LKLAALGIRVHSGWGALVAVTGDARALDVVDRRRIVTMDPRMAGAKQPFHQAEKLPLRAAAEHLRKCEAVSQRLASAAISDVACELRARGFAVARSAILLSSGRPLPSLQKTLASHTLIHTAEGEFFRRIFWQACAQLDIQVIGIRERDLDARASAVFGRTAAPLRKRIAGLGELLGPPWTADQKNAALVACMALAGGKSVIDSGACVSPAPSVDAD
jgi:hypothetical protein